MGREETGVRVLHHSAHSYRRRRPQVLRQGLSLIGDSLKQAVRPVLRTHGMSNAAIQLIYQAVIIAKLSYASPAWYGFTTSADRDRIEAFLRRSERLEFRKTGAQSFAEICSTSDDNLSLPLLSLLLLIITYTNVYVIGSCSY